MISTPAARRASGSLLGLAFTLRAVRTGD
jgi:hypothetical protein